MIKNLENVWPYEDDSDLFSKDHNSSIYMSYIDFSEGVKTHHDMFVYNVCLKTRAKKDFSSDGFYWETSLEMVTKGDRGYMPFRTVFGAVKGPMSNISEEEIIKQKISAREIHRKSIWKLEGLSLNKGIIQKDFLEEFLSN